MPGISDPGAYAIAAAIAAGARVEVVPGPSAVLAALLGSGLPAERFLFLGFPPREAGARRARLGTLRAEAATMIFYEAPTGSRPRSPMPATRSAPSAARAWAAS